MSNMQASATQLRNQSAIPDADQPQRLFQCSTCKRSFTRADHLTRHVRAHTKSKPYVCPVCTKGFARIDLLKRHVTNHDSESANKRQKREIARDTRVVQACEACSQSHLRCEDEKPCNRCKKKNIPCRVPEISSTDDNEIDAVHAAHDLLDLSNGFDYPSSLPIPDESTATPSPPRLNSRDDSNHYSHPSLASVTHTTDMMPSVPIFEAHERPLTVSNMHPPPNGTGSINSLHQPFDEETGNSLSFFDNTITNFDETPGHNPFLPDYFRNMPPFEALLSGQATPRGIMDMSFDLDVGLTDLDLGLLDQYNFQVPFAADTPSTDAQGTEQQLPENDNVPVRTEAFKQSIWRYLPQRNTDYSGAEQANLAFADSEKDNNRRAHITQQRRVIVEKLQRVSRDQLMALVLGTCSPENVNRIASAFPSIELLDGLCQYFLTSPSLDAQSWFHLPTFSPSKLSPELLACIVSAGAATTPDVALRKLGFALHEASRIGQARAFEADNTAIRDLQHLRNFFLQLKVGMWSGISRKMEIAESFLQPLMTMLRRGGRFRASTWKEIPGVDEQGVLLEKKWREWVDQESYLRLVYRAFELDRQSSMALLKPPLISYSEMQLPLPSANILWHAKSAAAWKTAYLDISSISAKRPSAIECFLDLEHLAHHDHASTTYLYMMWGLIWEYRQMTTLTMNTFSKANNSLILSSRYQELTKQLEDFRVSSPPLSKSLDITLELMLIHLNAPLDDIQLFAGLEGQDEARGAYPALREWTKSVSARQALWHAGQILRAAEALPKTLLCNFNAIAVYHAGLLLWGYGFIRRSSANDVSMTEGLLTPVVLNSDDSLSARRFITLNRGDPSIRSPRLQNIIHLSDVCGVMDGLIHLLRAPNDAAELPLVGNLVQLLVGLRSATK